MTTHRNFTVALVLLVLLSQLTGCSIFRSNRPPQEKAMRLADPPKSLSDDLPLESLMTGVRQNIAQLEKTRSLQELVFGPRKVPKADYVRALRALLARLEQAPAQDEVMTYLRENFEFHEIYGRKRWGEVFMTSYYEPLIRGSKERTEKFSRPLYGVPKDMVTIRFDRFQETFPQLRELEGRSEQKSVGSVLRGRLVNSDQGVPQIVPFYSRAEIDGAAEPVNSSAEIFAWVDPIESFFLQIQGSGQIELTDGTRFRIGYAAQNGHSYVAIGTHLLDVIPKEEMSLQAIDRHLRTLSVEERDRILNLNPSYVFFQKLEARSLTSFGSEVVDGRTIATDRRYFPKGALAYLEFEKPIFADDDPGSQPVEWRPTSRVVIDQDTGGAIRGPDRLDLYWGSGDKALQAAGIMKNWGRLYYLVPKSKFLSQLPMMATRP